MQYVKLNQMRTIFDFLAEVKIELEKIVWPTPQAAFKLTLIVIIVTITVGFFIGGVDYLLTKLLEILVAK